MTFLVHTSDDLGTEQILVLRIATETGKDAIPNKNLQQVFVRVILIKNVKVRDLVCVSGGQNTSGTNTVTF